MPEATSELKRQIESLLAIEDQDGHPKEAADAELEVVKRAPAVGSAGPRRLGAATGRPEGRRAAPAKPLGP